MDAIKFIKEYSRLCRNQENCNTCPLTKTCYISKRTMERIIKNPESLTNSVEKWSQSHPQKTMMQDFFEKFPNAPKKEDGTPLDICPSYCGYTDEPNSLSVCENFNQNCLKCWSRPLEQEKE